MTRVWTPRCGYGEGLAPKAHGSVVFRTDVSERSCYGSYSVRMRQCAIHT